MTISNLRPQASFRSSSKGRPLVASLGAGDAVITVEGHRPAGTLGNLPQLVLLVVRVLIAG
jgi:hypothetical protein